MGLPRGERDGRCDEWFFGLSYFGGVLPEKGVNGGQRKHQSLFPDGKSLIEFFGVSLPLLLGNHSKCDPEWGEWIILTIRQGLVGIEQIPPQDFNGPTVCNNLVNCEQKEMIFLAKFQQADAQGKVFSKNKWTTGIFKKGLVAMSLQLILREMTEINHGEAEIR